LPVSVSIEGERLIAFSSAKDHLLLNTEVPIAAAAENSVVRNARHNAAIAWIRLPISVVVSGFLFIFVDSNAGWIWLTSMLAIEVIAAYVRARLVVGDLRFRIPHLIAIGLVSIAWVTLGLMLWESGSDVARFASLVALFSMAFYGVAGGYKSAPILVVLVLPPLLALFFILTSYAWNTLDFGPALLTTFASFGACATVAFTGWALHKSDRGLETANADLRSLTSRLTLLAERERVASSAKDIFLANVSHEIRTPLNGIIGLSAALDTSALSARDRHAVDVIRQSGDMLERLISDVLDAAAIDAGGLQLRTGPFEPAAVARSAVVLMEADAASKGLSLSLAVSAETPPCVLGDDVRVRQIIFNLLSNAIKYTEVGGVTLEVGVEASADDGASPRLSLRVTDTGRGFDLPSHERLFERFERGDQPGSTTNAGLGLGLAITRALVGAMGGEIRVSSSVATGSTFEVLLALPRAMPSPDATFADNGRIATEAKFAGLVRPLRILLVEDHPINRLVVTNMLEAIGAQIETCVDGREAVEVAARSRFDVILMDLLMPVMDGFEATRAIRLQEAENNQPQAAIIMLTASALPAQVEQARQAGCNAHVTKPVTPARLFEALASVLPAGDNATRVNESTGIRA
jgi:two-component system, sensor histidine kinase